jgi:hypothetical protein
MDRRDKRIDNLPQNIWSLINQIDHLKGQWIGGAKGLSVNNLPPFARCIAA